MEKAKNTGNNKQDKLEEIQKRIAEIQSKSSGKKVTSKSATAKGSKPDEQSKQNTTSSPAKAKVADNKPTVKKTSLANPTPAQSKKEVPNKKTQTQPTKTAIKTSVSKTNEAAPKKTDSKWTENNLRNHENNKAEKPNKVEKPKPETQASPSDASPKKITSRRWMIYIVLLLTLSALVFFLWKYTHFFVGDTQEISEMKSPENVVSEDSQKGMVTVEGEIIISYSSNENELTAISNVQHLKSKGFEASYFWIPSLFEKGESLYKVYTGPYPSLEEATNQLKTIQEMRDDAYLLKAPLNKL